MARIDHAALLEQIRATADALQGAQSITPGISQDDSTAMSIVRSSLNTAGYALQGAAGAMDLVILNQQEEARR